MFHGQVYDEFRRDFRCVDIRCLDIGLKLYEVSYPNGTTKDIIFKRFIGGMDHGWNDPSVLLAIGRTNEDYYIIEECYAQHVNILVVDDDGVLEDCLVKRYKEMND